MTREPGTILVGYDGSSEADMALHWAAEAAALDGRTVRSITVVDAEDSSTTPSGTKDEIEVTARAEVILADAGVAGVAELRSGHPVSVLLQEANDVELLVVGRRGVGWAVETFMGSVSQHLARHAPCPVVVMRRPAQPEAARIVVGVDGSQESLSALHYACRRASLTKEPVVALHAWRPGPVQLDRHGQLPRDLGARAQAAEEALAGYVAGVQGDHPDVTVERETAALAPGLALTGASANASLVVTGSRGRGVFAGMLLGSVSHHVLQQAQCPVAVVR
jgi:nucleotide-binding universal stress UspA family protein